MLVNILNTASKIYSVYDTTITIVGGILLFIFIIFYFYSRKPKKTENFLVQTSEARQKMENGGNLDFVDNGTVIQNITNQRQYSQNQVFDIIEGVDNIETNKENVKSYNIKAINDNFLKSDDNKQVKSKNLKLDKDIINFLKSFIGNFITNKFPRYSKELNIKDLDDEEYSKFVKVSYINNEEVNYIFDTFIRKLNYKSGGRYLFKVLDIGKKDLYVKYNKDDRSYSKKLVVSFFIYENTIKFTKRLEVEFLSTQYSNKLGKVKILNISFPLDAQLDSQNILPPAIMPVKLNKINDLSNYFYGINNKLGLTAPFPVGENPSGLVQNETRTMKQQRIDENIRRRKIDKLKKEYRCFGNENLKAIPAKLKCLEFGGIWDKQAESPEECPYYQANTNYINKKGGVKAGYCELPDGLKRVGYRHYDKNKRFKPLCYNCKTNLIGQGTLGKCCEEQKENRQKYPNMVSPDYKFPGDSLDRLNSKRFFDRLNLSVN